jgi:hypothetical protein
MRRLAVNQLQPGTIPRIPRFRGNQLQTEYICCIVPDRVDKRSVASF